MQVYEELVARGLIAQVTDEERIRDLVNNGKAVFYIGFDPTADSLHGTVLNEETSDGRKQADCTDWRRYSNDRRSVWKDRYEKDDDKGDNRA